MFRIGRNKEGDEVDALATFQDKPHKSAKPHLIEAYLLSEIYPYIENIGLFQGENHDYSEAREWIAHRGTPYALSVALSWIDINGPIIHENEGKHWADYSLEVREKVLSQKTIASIIAIATLSTPARCRLTRIYHKDKDVRRMCLSSKKSILSRNILSNDSGVYNTSGVLVSLPKEQVA